MEIYGRTINKKERLIEIERGDKTLGELYSWVEELEKKMRIDEE